MFYDGNVDFLYLLFDYYLVIYLVEYLGELIGIGFYQVVSFVLGEWFVGMCVLEYYKDGCVGWFDCVEFIVVLNDGQCLNVFLIGWVDVMECVDLCVV